MHSQSGFNPLHCSENEALSYLMIYIIISYLSGNGGVAIQMAWSTRRPSPDGRGIQVCKTCNKPADRKPVDCSELKHRQHYESRRKASHKYYHSHKEKVGGYLREYNKHNQERIILWNRRGHLRRKYGITPEDIDAMLKEQDYKCKLCKKPFRSTPFVDHDHKAGRIRGLLCCACNLGVGHTERLSLQNLKEYLVS